MNKKNQKNQKTASLIFSAVLVTAFLICSYFFMGMIDKVQDSVLQAVLCILVFVVFGLFLFYATRVGDGKQVVRFSLSTLIIMDLPALYIILASVISFLPFSTEITSCAPIIYLASIVLGYGIPYTFLSGFELEATDSGEEADSEASDIEETDDDSDFEEESELMQEESESPEDEDDSDDSQDGEE